MDILQKIKALRAKAANRAASEAEAMAALDHADKLIQKHGITEADIHNQTSSSVPVKYWVPRTKKVGDVRYVQSAILRFTETEGWVDVDRTGRETAAFVGTEQDVEFAMYLMDLVQNAMNYEWERYRDSGALSGVNRSHKSKFRRDFLRSMASRLHENIINRAVKAHQIRYETGSGTQLVAMKRQIANQAKKEALRGAELSKPRRRTTRRYVNPIEAGKAAADRTRITTGIKEHT